MGDLGTVDPFRLDLIENPAGSGKYVVADPDRSGPTMTLDAAGLNLVGAGQALFMLSTRWLGHAGRELEPAPGIPVGEVKMIVRRREARLVAALLRRHLARLPEPPEWMREFLDAMEQIDEFLRWEEH
jgi:hypothetical protein